MAIVKPFLRSPYNYDVEEASHASAYVETMPSLTVQSQAEDADLNILMKRFGVTGKMPENARLPSYGDFSGVTDYRSAIHAAWEAEESFMQFPADIRAVFDNNPQLFLEYVENPANIEQVKKWFPKENLGEQQASSVEARGGAVQGGTAGGALGKADSGNAAAVEVARAAGSKS